MSPEPEPGHADRTPKADSAGVPWAGRTLESHPFAGDTGEPDAALATALRNAAGEAGRFDPEAHRTVVSAFTPARVYAPILAELGEAGEGHAGLTAEKSAEMAMVTLAAEDGRAVAPAFSGIPELTAWNGQARPVPVEARRLALAAVDEGSQLVVIDPGSPHAFLIRRPALWLLAQGRAGEWHPAWANPAVADAVAAAARAEDWIAGVSLRPGSHRVTVSGPELAVIVVPGGPVPPEGMERLRMRLATDAVIGEAVDSLALALEPGTR